MRQQHVAQAPVILRLMALEPEDFRRGESGQEQQAGLADGGLRAAEFFRKQGALGDRAGVAPQFGRANHLPCPIERHKAVLLARHADAAHPGTIHPGQNLENHGVEGRRPVLGVLFQVPDGQAVNQPVRRAGLRDHPLLLKV